MTHKEKRTELAVKHLEDIESRLMWSINGSYAATTTYGDDIHGTAAVPRRIVRYPEKSTDQYGKRKLPEEVVINTDTVSAIIKESKDYPRHIICALNFASYTHAGGGFLSGSMAQEEALCHKSTLYPVLKKCEPYYAWNIGNKNGGMYKNRALFSKNIIFEDGNTRASADVISCAAPNKSASSGPKTESEEKHQSEILRSRIRFVFAVAAENYPDILILGAWGCGVFGQDPKEVAAIMHELTAEYRPAKRIVYAVPSDTRGKENYEAFVQIIHRDETH